MPQIPSVRKGRFCYPTCYAASLIWLSLPALLCREAADLVSKFSDFSFANCDGVSACAAVQVHLAHQAPLALLMCVQAQHLKRSSGVLQLLLAGSQTRTRTNGMCPKLLLYRAMMDGLVCWCKFFDSR